MPCAISRPRRIRAFTLVEVAIATILFTVVAISVTRLFVQNNQMSMRLRYRTNATTAALNVLEQIRVLDYTALNTLYHAYDLHAPTYVTNAFVRVLITDPNAPNHTSYAPPDPTLLSAPGIGAVSIPLGYQNLDMVINVRNGTIINSTWNVPSLGLPLGISATAARMPMRFWFSLNYNNSAVSSDTTIANGDVFELVLVYQWQQPGSASNSAWQSGIVRSVVQNPTPRSTGS